MKTSRIIDLSVSMDPAHWEPEPVTRVEIGHSAGADLFGRSYMHFTPLPWWRKLALRLARRGKHFIDHRWKRPMRRGAASSRSSTAKRTRPRLTAHPPRRRHHETRNRQSAKECGTC